MDPDPDKRSKFIKIAVDARPLSSPVSGVSRVIAMVLKRFPDAGKYRFFLYSHRPYHPDFKDIISLPHVVWIQGRDPFSRWGGLWFNLSLPGIVRRSNISLFWGTQQVIPPFLPGDIRIVLTYHDLVAYNFPETMRTVACIQQRIFQRYSILRANRIVTNSEQTRSELIKKFNYPFEQTNVGLLGYEFPEKKNGGNQKNIDSTGNESLSVAIDTPYILAVSTMEPRKNYGTLIEAYEGYLRVEKKSPYPLVIAGRRGWESGKFYKKLNEIQRRTGMVHVLENLSEGSIRMLYENCAFFCLASRYEGFGLPVLEALCHGKLPIVSDIASFREIGGEFAVYIPPLDSSRWTEAISDAVERHRKGELKKIRFPVEEWGWNRAAKAHFAAFKSVLFS